MCTFEQTYWFCYVPSIPQFRAICKIYHETVFKMTQGWKKSYEAFFPHLASHIWEILKNVNFDHKSRIYEIYQIAHLIYFYFRYRTIRYEDFVLNPEKAIRDIHAWMNIPYTNVIESVVNKFTQLSKQDASPYGTIKKSSKRPTLWVSQLNFQEVSEIQSICSRVLEKYRYPLIHNSEEMALLGIEFYQ